MQYIRRSIKYFFALSVLCLILIGLNLLTGMATLTFSQTVYVMFHTPRGLMMPAVVVLLALFYPRFGFTVRRVEGDLQKHRTQVVNAFLSAGFSLRSEHDGVMTFRAGNLLKKLSLLGEDEIKVTQDGQWITVDGIRRVVVRVVYRLESTIEMTENE